MLVFTKAWIEHGFPDIQVLCTLILRSSLLPLSVITACSSQAQRTCLSLSLFFLANPRSYQD
ncbi:rCG52531 [Rattus norvegicus]|uniref:RCG52531 n=1 Tax=Rattus norvegicus TaxID=10116 RepID=A6IQS1_RAT|nr:rCG52531 [Rattus norvegicus]